MSKFLITLFLCIATIPAFGGCSAPVELKFASSSPDDDEYLFESDVYYTAAKAAGANTEFDKLYKEGKAYVEPMGYECDRLNSRSCTKNDTVHMNAGHVFKGQVVDYGATYRCNTWILGNDSWIEEDADVCMYWGFLGALKEGEKTTNVFGSEIDKSLCQSIEAEITDRQHGTVFELSCEHPKKFVCRPIKCDDKTMIIDNGVCKKQEVKQKKERVCMVKGLKVKHDMRYNVAYSGEDFEDVLNDFVNNNKKYVEDNPDEVIIVNGKNVLENWKKYKDVNAMYYFVCRSPFFEFAGCKGDYHPDDSGKCVEDAKKTLEKKTCREQRAKMSIEAIACCDTGSGAVWDRIERGKCVCVDSRGNKDSTKEFKIDNGRGKCVAKKSEKETKKDDDKEPIMKPVHNCPDDANPDGKGSCQCINDDMDYDGKECVCPKESQKRNGGCICDDDNKELKNGKCEYTAEHLAKMEKLLGDIDKQYNKLISITGNFEVSVWKDAEGNFNTTRLASDSIAGVVLGTVGGIVTATVVKKAQIKQGFEDIQCHIGGQSVANYGDGFTVGR